MRMIDLATEFISGPYVLGMKRTIEDDEEGFFKPKDEKGSMIQAFCNIVVKPVDNVNSNFYGFANKVADYILQYANTPIEDNLIKAFAKNSGHQNMYDQMTRLVMNTYHHYNSQLLTQEEIERHMIQQFDVSDEFLKFVNKQKVLVKTIG